MKKTVVLLITGLLILTLAACEKESKQYVITFVNSSTQEVIEEYTYMESIDFYPVQMVTNQLGYYIDGYSVDEKEYLNSDSVSLTGNRTIYIHYEPYEYYVSFYEADSDEHIIDIETSYSKTYIITSTNRVLAYGENKYGELGMTHEEFPPMMQDLTPQFDLEPQETINQISAGIYGTFFITSENRYFILGATKHVNFRDDVYQKPIDITEQLELQAGEIVSEVKGFLDYYLVTSKGRLLTLAFIKDDITVEDVTSSLSILSTDQIEHVYHGHTNFVLTKNGRVFAWGLNNNGQVGHNVIDYKTVDFSSYDASVTDRNFVKTPVEITSNFNLPLNEKIINIEIRQDTIHFITNLGRLFVTGHVTIDDIFVPDVGVNFQFTNLPVDLTYLLGLESAETIIDTYNFDGFILIKTNNDRVIAFGRHYLLIPNSDYDPSYVKEVTQYVPANINQAHSGNLNIFLDESNQLFVLGTTFTSRMPFILEHQTEYNFNEVQCPWAPNVTCISFQEMTNVTESLGLGYSRTQSIIYKYDQTLQIGPTWFEMYEQKVGTDYPTQPARNLFFYNN